MITTDLTQAEADALVTMEKIRVSEDEIQYPPAGGRVEVPLASVDRREDFVLDISRGRIDLCKTKYQNRVRHTEVLLRLDLGGPPHRNPDGEEIACPHLHVYREGFGDKWAIVAPSARFSDLSDRWQALLDFMRYCNIIQQPRIVKGLFS